MNAARRSCSGKTLFATSNRRIKMETREQKIAHAYKAFAEHKAELKVSGNMQIVDWRKPGTGCYRVRYVFDQEGGRIYISGDLGEAVVQPTWPATFGATCGAVCGGTYIVNEHYFLEKVRASSDRYEYDREEAEKAVREKCPGIDEDDLETVMSDFDDRWGLAHIERTACNVLEGFDRDYWEWFTTAGQSVDGRIYLWLVGLKMAWEALNGGDGK